MSSTVFTNGVTLTDEDWFNDEDQALYEDACTNILASVAGTNTITANAVPEQTAYKAGQVFLLSPANTTTGATTVNLNSLGAKNVFYGNAALKTSGGELVQSIPSLLAYDGTQFHAMPFNSVGGSWTPAIEGNSVGGTQTYTNGPVGRWRRIFDVVFFWGFVQMSAKDAATSGNIRVTGLPLASANVSNMQYAVSVHGWHFDLDAGFANVTGYVVPSTSQIQLFQNGDNTSPLAIDESNLLSTSQCAVSGMYFV
jgi:hypothetical protein